MSIDPYTGRNPSYCFIELKTKEQADSAMQQLSGTDILGRPAKLGPGSSYFSHKTLGISSLYSKFTTRLLRDDVFKS